MSWTGASLTYQGLYDKSVLVARALLASGVRPGDHVAIFAENCDLYIEVLFANAMISAVSVVLNTNYTPSELIGSLHAAGEVYFWLLLLPCSLYSTTQAASMSD